MEYSKIKKIGEEDTTVYIKKIIYKNVGPISNIQIDFRFTDKGNPVPVVIVGENGTGKSVFLSNIIDAFYELAGTAFNNVLQSTENGHQYYKTISPDQIKIGSSWLVAYMELEHGSEKLKYVFKSGEIPYAQFCEQEGIECDEAIRWADKGNDKKVKCDKRLVEEIFENTVVASFSPMRYEKPDWMGDKYFNANERTAFSLQRRYSGQLKNPISVECDSDKTSSWLFDVITDSRADLEKKNGEKGYTIIYPSTQDIDLLSVSRNNAEKLMSEILGQKVIFRMGNRSSGGRRLHICDNDGHIIVPSLDALSTGQLALFNMFSSIIRYADNDDINLSYKLDEISGIVLIDEIELHLHSKLQREVLPRMIALFPKVQFIITSHSPLFLLGLKDKFGEENIDIFEMPDAHKILTEDFSEFGKAYQYYSDSQVHKKDIRNAIESSQEKIKPLIITEGSTDWKHMKAAFNALRNDDRYGEWLSKLQFEFLEYEPLNSKIDCATKLQMSCSELDELCQAYGKLPSKRKMIFIADNDDPITKKDLDGAPYKKWSGNVYSFCLSVPPHRTNSNICIEHLYTDDEITRKVILKDEVERRIYLGSEFDKSGHLIEDGTAYFCNAMQNQQERAKNAIVDGSDKKKVIKIGSDDTNYALPKAEFAERVLNKQAPFDNMNFECFVPIFERIRDILEDSESAALE